MNKWFFNDEQTAIDAEHWICNKLDSLGIGFSNGWDIPVEDRLPPTEENGVITLGTPTGKWSFYEYKHELLTTDIMEEFYILFNPEMKEL